ncbi:MAG: hypothetical protein K0R38_7343, partial [Polyangiaceae bacterium]|nr:hypothetical protein [Polyangiaceae bacterium]
LGSEQHLDRGLALRHPKQASLAEGWQGDEDVAAGLEVRKRQRCGLAGERPKRTRQYGYERVAWAGILTRPVLGTNRFWVAAPLKMP